MRYGRIYGRVVDGVEIAYGDPVYLITSGDNAGMFTNSASSTGQEEEGEADDTIAIKGRFLCGVDSNIAIVELFNQAQV